MQWLTLFFLWLYSLVYSSGDNWYLNALIAFNFTDYITWTSPVELKLLCSFSVDFLSLWRLLISPFLKIMFSFNCHFWTACLSPFFNHLCFENKMNTRWWRDSQTCCCGGEWLWNVLSMTWLLTAQNQPPTPPPKKGKKLRYHLNLYMGL